MVELDETSRAGFRRQALDWLRAELEAQRRLLEKEPQTARLAEVLGGRRGHAGPGPANNRSGTGGRQQWPTT